MSPRLRRPRSVVDERVYTRTSTTLQPAARSCSDCRWPDRCRQDRLCWQAEKQAVAELRTRPQTPIVWTRELVIEAVHTHVAQYGVPPTTEEWTRKTATRPSYMVVQRLFGSWRAGLAEAGYEPQPSGFQARNRRKK